MSKESSSFFPNVHRKLSEFKRGRTSGEDEPRSGRQKLQQQQKL